MERGHPLRDTMLMLLCQIRSETCCSLMHPLRVAGLHHEEVRGADFLEGYRVALAYALPVKLRA